MTEFFLNLNGFSDDDDESNGMAYMTVLTVSCIKYYCISISYMGYRDCPNHIHSSQDSHSHGHCHSHNVYCELLHNFINAIQIFAQSVSWGCHSECGILMSPPGKLQCEGTWLLPPLATIWPELIVLQSSTDNLATVLMAYNLAQIYHKLEAKTQC